MQKLNGYLKTQYLSVIYSPNTATPNRSGTVYARPLKLYRGIDNTIQLRLLDVDQKAVNIAGKTLVFNIIDPSTKVVIKDVTGTIADPSQATQKGFVNFAFTESTLKDANGGRYIYSVHEETSSGARTVVYSGPTFDADGDLTVSDTPYATFAPSKILNFDTMTASTTLDISDYALSYPHMNQNNALHTAQYYLNGYTGTITVQVTLETTPPTDDNDWIDVSSKTYTTATGSQYETFSGVFTAVRFKSDKTAGTIEKVLYRP